MSGYFVLGYIVGAIVMAGVVAGRDPDADWTWMCWVAMLWPIAIIAYVGVLIGKLSRRV